MPRIYASARDRILDAAEKLILERGLGALSVDAVITAAELSKGGFFHHFPSKDALLVALLERLIERINEDVTAAAAKDPEPRGARLRAQISLSFDLTGPHAENYRALAVAFIEGAAAQPALVERARELNAQAFARDASEGIPEGNAIAIQLALDGYGLSQVLGSIRLSPRQRDAFRDSLMALAQPMGGAKARPARGRAAKRGKRP